MGLWTGEEGWGLYTGSLYTGFYGTFFKAINNLSNKLTCNTYSLIDHILTSSSEKIFQSGIINYGMSDH